MKILRSITFVPFLLTAASAQVIVTHNTLTTFDAVVGGNPVTVEDFTSSFHFPISTGILNSQTNLVVESGTPIVPGMIQPGVTYSTPIGTSVFFNIDAGADFVGGFLDTATGEGPLTITFDDIPALGFGFDTDDFMGTSFNITIFFSNDTSYTSVVPIISSTPMFYGFTSDAFNIVSVELYGESVGHVWGIDNFRFTSIPEPGTGWLLGLGTLGVFAWWRRRRIG